MTNPFGEGAESEDFPPVPVIPKMDYHLACSINAWLTAVFHRIVYHEQWGPGHRKRAKQKKMLPKRDSIGPDDDLFWRVLRKRFEESSTSDNQTTSDACVKCTFYDSDRLTQKPTQEPTIPPLATEDAEFLNWWLYCVYDRIEYYYSWEAGRKSIPNRRRRPNDDLLWDILREYFLESASFHPNF